MSNLYLYDFGIFLTLEPDEEEKQKLENNIQIALQGQLIELDDAIDVREVKNLKVANQLLKIKKKKKQEREQALNQQNIKAQAEANAQSAQAAAEAEKNKQQALIQSQIQLETAKNGLKIQYLQEEAALKKELMEIEFDYNQKNLDLQRERTKEIEDQKENRKDDRVRLQQEVKTAPPKIFESAGNDTLGPGAGIDTGGLAGQ